ncbi:hypothetical protein [Scytonema sp. NUACC26]|uniref:hypothetical protein n=1 Tax=Scytonema sp. NUACC26 TaxID=3140176 RepID=UPI0034DBCFDE
MLGQLPYCAFSFGGGVQSSAIYLMLMHEPRKLLEAMGELPDKVFFADTGAETASTYKALVHMMGFKSLHFEIQIVSNGSILNHCYGSGDYNPLYPFYIKQPDGKLSMAKRQCTSEFKIRAVQKACREAFHLTRKKLKYPTISQWLGISTDEPERVKTSEGTGFVTRYPLIELGMSRDDCVDYCKQHNWTPTKSRCYLCPYQGDAQWLELKYKHPGDFELACQQDERIRNTLLWRDRAEGNQPTAQCYLHRSCAPLREVQFKGEPDLWADECQGVCNT